MKNDNKFSEMKQDPQHTIDVAKNTSQEIIDGLTILRSINKDLISIFGSHVTAENEKDYMVCEQTAYLLGEKGYGIISGGGPGIMKAANSGAIKAKTASVGFKARLIEKEQNVPDSYFTHKYSFEFLFVRRYCLAVRSKALIFFPGGYGTLNEMFEYLTLIQTHMDEEIPVICVNKDYWKGLFDWLKTEALSQKYIDERHLKGIYFVNTPQEIVEIIENEQNKSLKDVIVENL